MHAYTSIMNRPLKSLSCQRNAVAYMEMSCGHSAFRRYPAASSADAEHAKPCCASQPESECSSLEAQYLSRFSKERVHLLLAVFGPQNKVIYHSLPRQMFVHIQKTPKFFPLHLKSSRLLHKFLSQYLIDYCCCNSS